MKTDWQIILSIFFLFLFSGVSIFSSQPSLFKTQIFYFILSFLIILLVSKINWTWLLRQVWFVQGFYCLSVFLLAITLFSEPIRGVKSWLDFGIFRFQTSEIAKISLIFVLSGFFVKRHFEVSYLKNILISFLYFALPSLLIAFQPDLGAILILFFIWVGFLIISGLSFKKLLIGFLLFVLTSAICWFYVLQPYQIDRILGFLFPERDPLGINYNVRQSKIAIGSAGFFGKGFQQGTQVQLGFLPEAHTDFIFSAFVEEWGIIGGIVLILVFLGLIVRIIKIGHCALSNWEKFICLGAVFLLGAQFFFNIGSCLGITPVVGLTLPFVSYGGSSLLTLSFLMAIIYYIRNQQINH